MTPDTWDNLKPPRSPHGRRLLIPQIDLIAQHEPNRPWIAVPVNNSDLTQGYKNITFGQFANAVNTIAHWLRKTLGQISEPFPTIAYTGPPDYGYALFAVAAGKLGYQIIPFGSIIVPAAQQKMMEQKDCTIYLYAQKLESVAKEVQKIDPRIRTICTPELEELTSETPAEPIKYGKSWEEAKDNPWLVFHTSGTTGFPKVITYSQQKMSTTDIIMGLEEDIGDSSLSLCINRRCYLPMAPAHYVSMFITLGGSVWMRCVPVYGPGGVIPSPSIVKNALQYGHVESAILVPALIDALCQDPESLNLLRKLKSIQYAGAPLSATAGKLLSSYVRLAPAIGSTDAGGYFVRFPNVSADWDYVSLQPHSGAVMEHRVDNLYELVFIQHPRCAVQSVFEGRPDLERFETNDLWVEHPTKKGQWKVVGRSDDLISLARGTGVMVASIELAMAEHPLIKSALVGGNGKPNLIILIEPVSAKMEEMRMQQGRAALIEELKPHIDQVNLQCHELAQLDSRLIVFATPDKPWPLTMKSTPMRPKVLKLYEPEIEEAYKDFVQNA